jgi:predicted acetyltransferase
LLEEACRLGIDRALVTIHADNAASKAAALANGGVISDQTEERVYVWIDTAQKNGFCI